jgi:hypothetical protein
MRAEFGTASRQLRVALSSLNFEGLSVLNLPTPLLQSHNPQAADKNAIRPFHMNITEAELTELRRRIKATKCYSTIEPGQPCVTMKRLGYTKY